MCGLVGVAGDLAYKDEQTMKRLFLLDYFRGPDSTGFAAIRNNGDAKIAKISSNPLDLFDMASFKEALNGLNSIAFMGHNRAATRGGVNTLNAHPFHFGHIVGAHNGTLDSASTKRLETELDEIFSVDSQALFAAIAKFGIKKTIELCNEGKTSSDGAWSLVWYDQNEGSLNFLRNKWRPLWYAFSKDFKEIFWASQWEMIDAAVKMSANGYELYTEDKTGYKFFQTAEDVHMKFDLNLLKAGGDKRPKPKAVKIKGREAVPVVTTMGNDPFMRQGGSMSPGFHTTPSSTTSTTNPGQTQKHTSKGDKALIDVVHMFGSNEKPYAGYITEEKFNDLAKYGCSWCGGNVAFGEPGITLFDRDDMLLCPPCSGHERSTTDIANPPPTRVIVLPATMESLR